MADFNAIPLGAALCALLAGSVSFAQDVGPSGGLVAFVNGKRVTDADYRNYQLRCKAKAKREIAAGFAEVERASFLLSEAYAQEAARLGVKPGLTDRCVADDDFSDATQDPIEPILKRYAQGHRPQEKEMRGLYDWAAKGAGVGEMKKRFLPGLDKEWVYREIVVADAGQARLVYDDLNKGVLFSDAMVKHSIAPAGSGASGWKRSYSVNPDSYEGAEDLFDREVGRGNMVIQELGAGEYNKQPFKNKNGTLSVFYVDKINVPMRVPPYDQAKGALERTLKNLRAREKFNAYLDSIDIRCETGCDKELADGMIEESKQWIGKSLLFSELFKNEPKPEWSPSNR